MKTNKNLTKDIIVSAAILLFAKQGYYKTTTAHVATQLGVSQPYMFHFFKTKEALFLAVLEHGMQQIFDAFHAETLKAETDANLMLCSMGEAFQRMMESHRNEMLLVMNAHTIDEETVREKIRSWHQRIFGLIHGRLESFGIGNARQVAADFIGKGLLIALSAQLDLPEINPYG